MIILRSIYLVITLLLATGNCFAAPRSTTLVQDGTSQFQILLPEHATPIVTAAAETLRIYIDRISGPKLPVSVGSIPLANSISFQITDKPVKGKNLSLDGFHTRISNNQIILTANTDHGLHNAVYSFLENQLGCRKYSPSVSVIPHQSTIVLPALDEIQIPTFSFRLQDFKDAQYNAWHKLNSLEDWGLFVHTFQTLVPPQKYFANHPEYFSENNGVRIADGQLCLSNSEVVRIVIEELRKRMLEKPNAKFWSVSQNDTYVPCTCSECRKVDDAEGSQSGSLLRFVNRVAAEFPDKTISTLAYQYSRSAPRLTKPAPNVNIMLCSIECDRSRPIADSPSDASFIKDLQDWSKLTKNIFLWDYVIQFRNMVSPFPNLHVIQPNLQYFAKNGINTVFEQGISEMHGEFAELRTYLIAKLLWNPELDRNTLVNDFLQGYYGSAAPYLRQYIDTMQVALVKSGDGLSCFGYPFYAAKSYLSGDRVEQYNRYFDQAEIAVAGNPEILERVRTARLPLQYAQLELGKLFADNNRGCFTRTKSGLRTARPEFTTLLDTFYVRCKRVGISKLWEHGVPPEEYFSSCSRFLQGSTEPHQALEHSVNLTIPASPKYHEGQAEALTDGLIGWDDYHMHWLGFEGEDMQATIDLGAIKPVTYIETAFLQDNASWIFRPESVEFFASDDGKAFRSVGCLSASIDSHQEGTLRIPLSVRFFPISARYIQVKAVNMKQCPPWHKGAGGKAWIFCDEIKVF